MKKLLSVILIILTLTTCISVYAEEEKEMRGVWFSFEDYAKNLGSLTEDEYRAKADEICKNISSSGFNTIIFHVRAYSDAFYDSSYFTYSKYVSGQAGVSPGYDPLRIMCEIAHENGLELHAWINPYRIGTQSNITESSVAYVWQQTYGEERVCEVDGKLYYNPASEEVRQYIVEGVREIVQNYPVDGIHFDDYFYPTTEESFDADSYAASGTTLTLNEWRIENVNLLIKKTYDSIKEIKPDVVFGISPNADIEKNYSSYYADVRKWGSEAGYVDYLAPQIYFGYKNSTMPFDHVLEKWEALCTVPELYIGLATYKAGKEDKWAGEGKNEWIENCNICARQIEDIRTSGKAKGFMLFCYSPIYDEDATENAKAELSAIKVLTTESTETNTSDAYTGKSILEAFINMLKALFNIFK